ncbi:MAG: hypothetical protein ACRYFK_01780 [Janthinobacterium lividum]
MAITAAFVGMTPSSYGTSALYVFNAGPHEADLQVNLAADYKVQSLDALKDQLRQAVARQLPDVRLSFEPIELTDKIMSQGAQTPIEVLVGGKNLADGQAYAERLVASLKRISYLRDVRINQLRLGIARPRRPRKRRLRRGRRACARAQVGAALKQ